MTSGEADRESGALDVQQQADEEASSARDGEPVHDDITLSSKLEEAWPRMEMDGERALVVCTIDIQLLAGTVQMMHSQIELLRQTILNLRKTGAQEMGDLRRQIGALEKLDPISAKALFDDIDVTPSQIKRLELLEDAIWGRSAVAGQASHLNIETSAEAAAAAAAAAATPAAATPAAALEDAKEEELHELVGHPDDGGGGEGGGEDVGDGEGAAARTEPKMRTWARKMMMFGGMAADVGVLQRQIDTFGEREENIETRVAALERQLAADAEAASSDAAEQRLKLLWRLMRQTTILRDKLVADGIAACAEGERGVNGVLIQEEALWAAPQETAGGGGRTMGGGGIGGDEQAAEEEDLILAARARLAWLENHAEETPSLGTSLAGAVDSSEMVETQGSNQPIARESDVDGGEAVESTQANGDIGDVRQRAKGDLPALAWKAPGEDEGASGAGWAVNLRNISAGGGTTDVEVDRLWCRMDEIEGRIYRICADRERQRSQAAKAGGPKLAEVTGADLRHLQESMEQSSLALGLKLQDGLGSLSRRIELLEDNVQMVKARALSRSAIDAVAAAAAAAAAASATPGSSAPHAIAPPDDSRIEQILTKVLGNEIPMVRRGIEGLTERVTSLEEAMAGAKEAGPPGLSAEEAAAAAADAARQANEETQARMVAEMSALEERVDRRVREEARRTREDREAAEARGAMRRVSAVVSAYTADLATRLEGLRSEHEQQGVVVTRTAEEIAAAEANLRTLGSELVELGQVANSVSVLVDGKADQMDVEALKDAMQRLDATIAAKARGSATAAARDAEALGTLQAAFKDMSSSMEASMRKLQQAQAAAGSIKIKPLLDRVVLELTEAGLLPDPDGAQGAVGRSVCLSCNRPMTVAGESWTSTHRYPGATLGSRMEKLTSAPPLQINKPSMIWRGGFKMPPRRVPATPQERLQQQQQQQQEQQEQHQHQQQQHYRQQKRTETAGATGGGGRRPPMRTSSTQILPPSDSVLGGGGSDAFRDSKLPGIPNILDSAGRVGHEITGAGAGAGGLGVAGRGKRGLVGSVATSSDAPHRGRFVRPR